MKSRAFKSTLAAALVGVVLAACPVEASLILTDFSNGGSGNTYTATGTGSDLIPDNTRNGVGYALNFSGSGSVSDISITLTLSGGYNGDMYAYLSHNGTLIQLLNPNSAVSGSGMNLTLIEGTGNYLPTGGSGVLTGTYTAYQDLAGFNNMDASGQWTLFFADLAAGDTSTLTGFSIGMITAVPEPVNVALATFGGIAAVYLARARARRRFSRTAARA